jgi:hypothetical protein
VGNHVIKVGTAHVNLSPTLFHQYAIQYLACHRSFVTDAAYSPVPYFLLCRAIEFELKAQHLEFKSRAEVKNQYGHNIKRAYDDLPAPSQSLDTAEYSVLVNSSHIYANKGFEYVSIGHAVTNLQGFPELVALEHIASKLIEQ